LNEARPVPTKTEPALSPRPNFAVERAQILLVDDQPARLLTYEAILNGLNLTCVRSLSGLEALQKLLEGEYALILLDVSMPVMDGFETARMIREHPRFERTPIIFVTGVHVTELDRLKGYEIGAIDYISVPIVPEILRSKVAVLIELYQRRLELKFINKELEAARERVRVEHTQQLAASEARSRAMFEHPAQLSLVVQARRGPDGAICDWIYTEVNTQGLVMLGLTREALIGKSVGEVFSERTARLVETYERVLESGVPAQCEISYAEKELLINIFPLDGQTLIASGLDITKRKKAESALRQSEERFRSVFFDAGVGMVLMDAQCRMLMVNPTYCAIVGRDSEELIGTSFLSFTHPDDVPANRQVVATLMGGASKAVLEKRYVLRDGEMRWVRVNLTRIPAEDANNEGRLLAVVEDVSERVQARRALESLSYEREQLLEAERAARSEAEVAMRSKDEFLATLSHELRTPLANVISWAQVLQHKIDASQGDLARGLKIIVDNALAQSQLISDLLDMSRIAAGKFSLETNPVDWPELIREGATAHRPAAESKGLTLRVDTDLQTGVVLGDRTRLQQVLWNLISNAIKFTPPDAGAIVLRLSLEEGQYKLTITDPGEGIDPRFLPYIFQRFRQADGSIARRHGGMGLGLTIAKQLVEMHGGRISVESPGIGQGSTFAISLPVPHPETQRLDSIAAEQLILPSGKVFDGYRILAVEDQPTILEHLKLVLEEYGAEVVAVASAKAALDLLELPSSRFHLLISDLGLPELDGYQLIRTIRQRGLTKQDLPALALTAFARDEDRVRSTLEGYQAHLVKPYQVPHLIAAVRSLLARAAPSRSEQLLR
jgi:PAS domain S-box-containing protein